MTNRNRSYFLTVFILIAISYSYVFASTSDSLRSYIKKSQNDTSKVNALNELAQELMHEDYKLSFTYAYQALDLSKRLSFDKGMGNSYHILGNLYDFNDADSSLYYLNKAKVIKQKLKDFKGLASTYIGIGTYFDKQNDASNALDSYFSALKIFDSIKSDYGVAASCLGIGNVFQTMNNYSKAIEYYQRSAAAYKKTNSPYLSWALNNLANSYEKIGKRTEAIQLYNQSLEMKLKEEDYYGAVFSINNIGLIEMKNKNYDAALKNFKKALAINRSKKLESETFANSYRNISTVYLDMKFFKLAIPYIDSILPIALEIKNYSLLEDYYKLKSEYFEGIGSYKEACAYKNSYIQLRDSVLTYDINKQVADADARYKNEKKQKEIELLQRDNQISQLELLEQNSRLQKQTIFIFSIIIVTALLVISAFLLINRNRIKQRANEKLAATNIEIQLQKDIVEHKQKEIIDSINYSKRLQQSLLPTEKYIEKTLNRLNKKNNS